MLRKHRSWHLMLWLILAPVMIGLAVAAVVLRADPPITPGTPAGASADASADAEGVTP